jgi:hypothetical protein
MTWDEVNASPALRARFDAIYKAAFTPRTTPHSHSLHNDTDELESAPSLRSAADESPIVGSGQ